jgi:glucosylceramidase
MKKIAYSAMLLLAAACTEQKTADVSVVKYDATGKTVSVFTTADSTDYRLTSTATLEFKEKRQPPENEISVFVDPTKTYQEFLGVGLHLPMPLLKHMQSCLKTNNRNFSKLIMIKKMGLVIHLPELIFIVVILAAILIHMLLMAIKI